MAGQPNRDSTAVAAAAATASSSATRRLQMLPNDPQPPGRDSSSNSSSSSSPSPMWPQSRTMAATIRHRRRHMHSQNGAAHTTGFDNDGHHASYRARIRPASAAAATGRTTTSSQRPSHTNSLHENSSMGQQRPHHVSTVSMQPPPPQQHADTATKPKQPRPATAGPRTTTATPQYLTHHHHHHVHAGATENAAVSSSRALSPAHRHYLKQMFLATDSRDEEPPPPFAHIDLARLERRVLMLITPRTQPYTSIKRLLRKHFADLMKHLVQSERARDEVAFCRDATQTLARRAELAELKAARIQNEHDATNLQLRHAQSISEQRTKDLSKLRDDFFRRLLMIRDLIVQHGLRPDLLNPFMSGVDGWGMGRGKDPAALSLERRSAFTALRMGLTMAMDDATLCMTRKMDMLSMRFSRAVRSLGGVHAALARQRYRHRRYKEVYDLVIAGKCGPDVQKRIREEHALRQSRLKDRISYSKQEQDDAALLSNHSLKRWVLDPETALLDPNDVAEPPAPVGLKQLAMLKQKHAQEMRELLQETERLRQTLQDEAAQRKAMDKWYDAHILRNGICNRCGRALDAEEGMLGDQDKTVSFVTESSDALRKKRKVVASAPLRPSTDHIMYARVADPEALLTRGSRALDEESLLSSYVLPSPRHGPLPSYHDDRTAELSDVYEAGHVADVKQNDHNQRGSDKLGIGHHHAEPSGESEPAMQRQKRRYLRDVGVQVGFPDLFGYNASSPCPWPGHPYPLAGGEAAMRRRGVDHLLASLPVQTLSKHFLPRTPAPGIDSLLRGVKGLPLVRPLPRHFELAHERAHLVAERAAVMSVQEALKQRREGKHSSAVDTLGEEHSHRDISGGRSDDGAAMSRERREEKQNVEAHGRAENGQHVLSTDDNKQANGTISADGDAAPPMAASNAPYVPPYGGVAYEEPAWPFDAQTMESAPPVHPVSTKQLGRDMKTKGSARDDGGDGGSDHVGPVRTARKRNVFARLHGHSLESRDRLHNLRMQFAQQQQVKTERVLADVNLLVPRRVLSGAESQRKRSGRGGGERDGASDEDAIYSFVEPGSERRAFVPGALRARREATNALLASMHANAVLAAAARAGQTAKPVIVERDRGPEAFLITAGGSGSAYSLSATTRGSVSLARPLCAPGASRSCMGDKMDRMLAASDEHSGRGVKKKGGVVAAIPGVSDRAREEQVASGIIGARRRRALRVRGGGEAASARRGFRRA